MTVSAYLVISKEVENYIFRHNRIFRHTCMHKQPTLTKQWSYNISVEILYSYSRYTGILFPGCVLAVILLEHHEKPRRKD